jgi:hypothetical protein
MTFAVNVGSNLGDGSVRLVVSVVEDVMMRTAGNNRIYRHSGGLVRKLKGTRRVWMRDVEWKFKNGKGEGS